MTPAQEAAVDQLQNLSAPEYAMLLTALKLGDNDTRARWKGKKLSIDPDIVHTHIVNSFNKFWRPWLTSADG
jgi:hypothetical protein